MTGGFLYLGKLFVRIGAADKKSGTPTKIQKKFLICFIILAVFFLIAFRIFLSERMNTKAAEAHSYKYYTTIQVEKGDSLWKIARTYITDDYTDLNAYIREVREINRLTDDQIRYGQYITIPYYSDQYY